MKRIAFLILFVCLATSLFGAISAATVWEIRSATGADTNGGGYAGGGTDMSVYDNKNASGCSNCQSAASNLSTTALATNASSTSSPFPVDCASCSFTSAISGNLVYLTGGSPAVTTGWYQATYVSATQINLDRSPGTTTTTGATINIGGALQTFAITSATIVAGNTIYADGTFTATITEGVAGTSGSPIQVIGYHTTRGSGTATLDGTTSLTYLITSSGGSDYWSFYNWVFKGGTTAQINTGSGQSRFGTFKNIVFDGTTGGTKTPTIVAGTTGIGGGRIFDFEVKNFAMTAAGLFKNGTAGTIFDYGNIHDNSGNQYLWSWGTAANQTFRRLLIHDNSAGSASNGVFNITSTSATDAVWEHVTLYNNNGTGINVTSGMFKQLITDSVIVSQVGAPITCGGAGNALPQGTVLRNNRFYGNGSSNSVANCYDGGNNSVFGGAPFVNAGGGDFTLGTSYRATSGTRGFLGSSLTSGSLDAGAIQHSDPAGGGGVRSYTYIGEAGRLTPDQTSGTDWQIPGLASSVLLGLVWFAARRG